MVVFAPDITEEFVPLTTPSIRRVQFKVEALSSVALNTKLGVEEVTLEPLSGDSKFIVGEIIPYAKEIGYKVVDSNGNQIDCSDYVQAMIFQDVIKRQNVKTIPK